MIMREHDLSITKQAEVLRISRGSVYYLPRPGASDARASIGAYLSFYNGRRPHSSLDGMTPDRAYCKPLPLRLAA